MTEKDKFVNCLYSIATSFFNSNGAVTQTIGTADKWFLINIPLICIIFIEYHAGNISFGRWFTFPPADQFVFWCKCKQANNDSDCNKNSFHVIGFLFVVTLKWPKVLFSEGKNRGRVNPEE